MRWIVEISGLIVFAIVIAESFALAKYKREKGKTRKAGDDSKGEGSPRIPWVYPIATVGYLGLIIGIAYIWPTFWEWLWRQRPLFWWTIAVLPMLAFATVKFKSLWGLTIIGGMVAI